MGFLSNLFGGNSGPSPMDMLRQSHQYSLENERKARELFGQAGDIYGQSPQSSAPGYNEAFNVLGQNPQYINQYLSPYLGLSNLVSEKPEDILSRLGSSFQSSPGYKYNVEEATRAANNAANAGGYAGSPQHQIQLAKEISGIASQDYNQYLNNALGLHGLGQQMGYGAAMGSANTLSDMLKSQAILKQQQAQNAYNAALQQGAAKQALGSGMFGQTAPQMQNAQVMATLADTERANRLTGIGNALGVGGDMFGDMLGGRIGGAAKGAAAGMAFGPIGGLLGGALGGLFGGK